MPAHYRAWLEILEPYGVPFSEERFYSMGGMPTPNIVKVLFEEAGVRVACIVDDTPPEERRAALQRFHEGTLDVLVNVTVRCWRR